jgi:hypothetical protein
MSLEGHFVFCSLGRSAFQPPAVKSHGSTAMTTRYAPAARQCAGAGPRDSRYVIIEIAQAACDKSGATHCLAHLAAQPLPGALKTPRKRAWLWYPEGTRSYSYRRISTGSSLAAARAGSIVAPMEMPIATTVIHTPSQILG